MSFYRHNHLKFAVLLVAAAAALALAGCGFRPLYGHPDTAQSGASEALAQVEIQPIKDRIGQQLHNLLLARLNPKGRPADPRYILVITVTEGVQGLGVQKTSVVTRANLRVGATYTLSRIEGAPPLKGLDSGAGAVTGSAQSVSSYDISNADFTTLIAVKDARARAVRDIAETIRTRLAVHFLQHRYRPAPPAPAIQ